MITQAKLTELENHVAFLRKNLDDTIKFAERNELDLSEKRQVLQALRDNLRNLRRNSVIVVIEEFSKLKKTARMIVAMIEASDKNMSNLTTNIEKQKRVLAQQEQKLKEAQSEFYQDNVISFPGVKNG
jgi:hypothetical protein